MKLERDEGTSSPNSEDSPSSNQSTPSVSRSKSGWKMVRSPRTSGSKLPKPSKSFLGTSRRESARNSDLSVTDRIRRRNEAFEQTVKKMSEGYDHFTQVRCQLLGALKRATFPEDNSQFNITFDDLTPRLQPTCDFYTSTQREAMLEETPITQDNPLLERLSAMSNELIKVAQLCETPYPDIASYCKALAKHYQDDLEGLCDQRLSMRKNIALPRATLFGLKSVYFVDPKLARDQICRDMLSNKKRFTSAGSHPTSRLKLSETEVIWNKPNTTPGLDDDYLCEADSRAMEILYTVLSDIKIGDQQIELSTVTRYLKYAHIPVEKVHPAISTQPGYIERVTQASDDACGFSMEDLLLTKYEFEQLTQHFGAEKFAAHIDQWHKRSVLNRKLFSTAPNLNHIARLFELLARIRKEVDFLSTDTLDVLIPKLNDSKTADSMLLTRFPELDGKSISDVEYALKNEMCRAAIPAVEKIMKSLPDEVRPSYFDAFAVAAEKEKQRIISSWVCEDEPAQDFIEVLALCLQTPELLLSKERTLSNLFMLSNYREIADNADAMRLILTWLREDKPDSYLDALDPKLLTPALFKVKERTPKNLYQLPTYLKLAQRIYPQKTSAEMIARMPKILRDHLHPEATSIMFLVHLLARFNDANFQNVFFTIVQDNNHFWLVPKDIDCDRWWAHAFYSEPVIEYVQVEGQKKRERVIAGYTHKVGIKSQLFAVEEILNLEFSQSAKDKLLSQKAITYLKQWLGHIYERDLDCERLLEEQQIVDNDLMAEGKDWLGYYFQGSKDMIPGMIFGLTKLLSIIAKPKITLREINRQMFDINAAVYEEAISLTSNPVDTLQLVYRTPVEIILGDQVKQYEERLANYDQNRAEMNLAERNITSKEMITELMDTYRFDQMTDDELLEEFEQVGQGFPFINSIAKLQNDQQRYNNLLRRALLEARVDAVKFLLRAGANPNDKHPGFAPPLHVMISKINELDYHDQFWPIFDALLNDPRTDVMLKDHAGDTPLHLLCRQVNTESLMYREHNVFLALRKRDADLIPVNKEGLHAFDVAFAREDNYDLCMCLIMYFEAFRHNTDSIESLYRFVVKHRRSIPKDNKEFHTFYSDHQRLQYQLVIDYITREKPGPEPGWVAIEGAESGLRYLTPRHSKWFIDQKSGRINAQKSNGLSKNRGLLIDDKRYGAFAKEEPENPGYQHAVYLFRQMLMNQGTAYSELFKFTDSQNIQYPVSISSHMMGATPNAIRKFTAPTQRKLIDHVDHFNLSGIFITSAVCKNNDGNLSNFRHPESLVLGETVVTIGGYDDEQFFMVNALSKDSSGKTQLHMKDWIFCLNDMFKPLHPKMVKRVQNLSVKQFLEVWLDACQIRHEQHMRLFNNQKSIKSTAQKYSWLQKDKDFRETKIALEFSQAQIEALYKSFSKLKNIVDSNPNLPMIEILFRMHPKVGALYLRAHSFYSCPFTIYEYIANGRVTMMLGPNVGTAVGTRGYLTSNIACHNDDHTEKYSPKNAKQFLVESSQTELITEVLVEQIKQGNFEVLNGSSSIANKNKALASLNFQALKTNIQKGLLSYLSNTQTEISELSLRHCHIAKDKDFKKILKLCGSNLRKIDFTGSTGFTKKLLDFINTHICCVGLEEIILDHTDVEEINFTLPALNLITVRHCSVLSKMTLLNCEHLKDIKANNCTLLEKIYTDSPAIRSIDLQGCKNVRRECITALMLSENLDNINLDSSRPDFNRRYLTLQCINQHKWNEKKLMYIIEEDGRLDLAGFRNLCNQDLKDIADLTSIKEVKGVPMPEIKVLDLRNKYIPYDGLLYFLTKVKTVEQVLHSNVNIDDCEIGTIENGIEFKEKSLVSIRPFETGEVAAIYSKIIEYLPQKGENIDAIRYSPEAPKDIIQLPNGLLLSCTGNSLKIANQFSTRHIRHLYRLPITNDYTVKMEHCGPDIVLISAFHEKKFDFQLYALNTHSYELNNLTSHLATLKNVFYFTTHNANTIVCLHDRKMMTLLNPFTGHIILTTNTNEENIYGDPNLVSVVSNKRDLISLLFQNCVRIFSTDDMCMIFQMRPIKENGSGFYKSINFIEPHYLVYSKPESNTFYDLKNEESIAIRTRTGTYLQSSVDVYGNIITCCKENNKMVILRQNKPSAAINHALLTSLLSRAICVNMGTGLVVFIPEIKKEQENDTEQLLLILKMLLPNSMKLQDYNNNTVIVIGISTELKLDTIFEYLSQHTNKDQIFDLALLKLTNSHFQMFVKSPNKFKKISNVPTEYLNLDLLNDLVKTNPELSEISTDSESSENSSLSSSPNQGDSSKDAIFQIPGVINFTFRNKIFVSKIESSSQSAIKIVLSMSKNQSMDHLSTIQKTLKYLLPQCDIELDEQCILIDQLSSGDQIRVCELLKQLLAVQRHQNDIKGHSRFFCSRSDKKAEMHDNQTKFLLSK